MEIHFLNYTFVLSWHVVFTYCWETEPAFWLAQAYSVVGVAYFSSAPFQASKAAGLRVQSYGAFALGINFVLLDASAGVVGCLFIIIRNIVMEERERNKLWAVRRGWTALFIVVGMLLGTGVIVGVALGRNSLVDLLPMVANVIATIGAALSFTWFKLGITSASFLWVWFCIATGNPGAAVARCVTGIAGLLGMRKKSA